MSLFLGFPSTKGLKSLQWKAPCYSQWLVVTFIIAVIDLLSNYKAQLFSHVLGLLIPSSHFPHPNRPNSSDRPQATHYVHQVPLLSPLRPHASRHYLPMRPHSCAAEIATAPQRRCHLFLSWITITMSLVYLSLRPC